MGLFFFTLIFAVACRENGSGDVGTVSLNVRYAQSFDPNAVHGDVVEYRVTVSSTGLAEPIFKVFPAGTPSATFDGFAGGTELAVLVEYVNEDGLVVRRGRAESVIIRSGTDTPADVTVNNVPIFTNVRDGATVASDRFVPRVFAPGISFEIEDGFDGAINVLPDVTSGEVSFSIADGGTVPVMAVRIPKLPSGAHGLTVRDPLTGESSYVSIRVVERGAKPALATTAGGYAGSLLGEGDAKTFNLARYFKILAGE
jgi:hypothetical protein